MGELVLGATGRLLAANAPGSKGAGGCDRRVGRLERTAEVQVIGGWCRASWGAALDATAQMNPGLQQSTVEVGSTSIALKR